MQLAVGEQLDKLDIKSAKKKKKKKKTTYSVSNS